MSAIFDKISLYPDHIDVVAPAVKSCYAKINPFGFLDQSSAFVAEYHSEIWHEIHIESGRRFKDVLH